MKHPPRGKIKPFCVACGAVDMLRKIDVQGQTAIMCYAPVVDQNGEPQACSTFYGNHSLLWEKMKEHPQFEAHVAKDKAKLEAAEAKRERKTEKRKTWGAHGIG